MEKNSKNKRVTMGDVAKAAGVSKPVVSAVLKRSNNNNSRFSRETMDRVLAVVRELNYRPNRTARKFVTQKNSTIGLLFSRIGYVGQQTLAMMAQWGAIYDLEIIVERILPNELPRFLKEDMVDAIVVFEKLSPELEQEIERLEIPLVCINSDGGVKNASYILFDEKRGIEQLLDYFSKQGKTHPLVILPDKSDFFHYSHKIRLDTLNSYSGELGIKQPVLIEPRIGKPDYEGGIILEAVNRAFSAKPEIDCVIVDWAYDAICVYDAAKKLGKKIPADVSIACIRDGLGGVTTRLTPQLTGLNMEDNDLGRSAILLINDLFSGKSGGNETVIMPYTLNIRGS